MINGAQNRDAVGRVDPIPRSWLQVGPIRNRGPTLFESSSQEIRVPKVDGVANSRSVGEIESDLLAAESAYGDAEKRLKDAQRERQAALEAINKHQTEFDQAIAQLRERSSPDSRWGAGGTAGEMLMLGSGVAIQAPAEHVFDARKQPKPQLRSVSAQFDHLRSVLEDQAPNGNAHEQES